jgi:hypothetical protein
VTEFFERIKSKELNLRGFFSKNTFDYEKSYEQFPKMTTAGMALDFNSLLENEKIDKLLFFAQGKMAEWPKARPC